mgnify:CR=1 FL=1
MQKIMADKIEAGPGYVITDSQSGTLFIGPDDGVSRKRQVELHASSNACVKLFEDGGFEIQGQSTGKFADNIISQCKDGLVIKANNIRFDAGGGEITFAARTIKYESTGTDQDLVIRANGNLKLEAGDTVRIDGSVVAIGARTRMAIFSKGSLNIRGCGVNISEPQTKLIPTNLSDFTNLLLSNLFPDYF